MCLLVNLFECVECVYWQSLMAKWLGQVAQGHEVYCHDLEGMGSGQTCGGVKLVVRSISLEVVHEPKLCSYSACEYSRNETKSKGGG